MAHAASHRQRRVVGWEAPIVLQDRRGLSLDDQLETSLWAARALIRATLEDSQT